MSSLVRVLLVIVAIVGGALALNVLGPTKPDVGQHDVAVSDALLAAELNEESADGAPQQAVVNGWVARDLAVVQIDQNNELLEQQAKTNQLLFVGLVVGSLFLALLADGRGRSSDPDRPGLPEATASERPAADAGAGPAGTRSD